MCKKIAISCKNAQKQNKIVQKYAKLCKQKCENPKKKNLQLEKISTDGVTIFFHLCALYAEWPVHGSGALQVTDCVLLSSALVKAFMFTNKTEIQTHNTM